MSHHEPFREILKEINKAPLNCHSHDVHLTFDDGPSPSVTPELLKELKKRKIKATFLVTTSNLEKSYYPSEKNISIVSETLREGHQRYSRQVALFHDTKTFNKEAVPVIVDIEKCMGLKFISPQEMVLVP